jgi:hypothetical protein
MALSLRAEGLHYYSRFAEMARIDEIIIFLPQDFHCVFVKAMTTNQELCTFGELATRAGAA